MASADRSRRHRHRYSRDRSPSSLIALNPTTDRGFFEAKTYAENLRRLMLASELPEADFDLPHGGFSHRADALLKI